MRAPRGAGLIVPALVVIAVLLAAPLLMVGDESLRLFVPGRVGSVHDAPLTLGNYADLVRPAYARYFADTFGSQPRSPRCSRCCSPIRSATVSRAKRVRACAAHGSRSWW